MPLESLIRHYLYGRSIASARIRNFLVLEYGRVTDKKKKKKKKKKNLVRCHEVEGYVRGGVDVAEGFTWSAVMKLKAMSEGELM